MVNRLTARLRYGFDVVSRYKHKEIPPASTMTVEELRKEGYLLDEKGWLNVRHPTRNFPRINY
jgi:hypothetical protein